MKIMTVVGARPNFMKVAPLITAISEWNSEVANGRFVPHEQAQREEIHNVLIHTGQHYDDLMSGSFFADLQIPKPDIHLGVGSASHAAQTAEIMSKFEAVLLQEKPDVVLVVGDVNSTVACALVAAKICFDSNGARPLIAHVEAGLRSFDRTMPEEINRILTDHVSDLLFVTEESGIRNLRQENIPDSKVHFVGNTMIDSLLAFKEKAETSTILEKLGLGSCTEALGSANGISRYALLTLHRPANVDNRECFLNIIEGLKDLASCHPIVFPAHPRTQKRIAEFGLQHLFESKNVSSGANRSTAVSATAGFRLINPLGYLDFLCLMKHASLVVTDSGGIQEETTCLSIPCVTVRENTERPVTMTGGTNVLAGVHKQGIRDAVTQQFAREFYIERPPKWDGKAGRRIVGILLQEIERRFLRQPETVAVSPVDRS